MKSNSLPILAALLAFALSAAADLPAPSFAGLSIGMSRTALMDSLSKSPLFKEAEASIDSNALLVFAKGKSSLVAGRTSFLSIKCMFNKKKTLQAMSIVFPAKDVDEVTEIFRSAKELLGEPKTVSSKQAGFKLEAEWHFGKYGATFFASDTDFEAYLLLAFQSFVREEELRGESHPQ